MNEQKNIAELFGKLTGKKSMWEVFNDVVTIIALSIQNAVCVGKKFRKNENEYLDIIKKYDKCEVDVIVQIYAMLVNIFTDNPFQDLLGDLYMRLNMGSNALGQFFTPYHIAKFNAEVAIDFEIINKIIKEKGYVTIAEPTVGGGANIIAACEVLQKNGINYQDKCFVVCQELSRLTALMCYIALSLIGCSAIIKVGDTLLNPFTNYFDEIAKGSELWLTPMFVINNGMHKV